MFTSVSINQSFNQFFNVKMWNEVALHIEGSSMICLTNNDLINGSMELIMIIERAWQILTASSAHDCWLCNLHVFNSDCKVLITQLLYRSVLNVSGKQIRHTVLTKMSMDMQMPHERGKDKWSSLVPLMQHDLNYL